MEAYLMKPAWLEKFRRWLDDTEASFEINPPPKPLSQAEHLFLSIAREVEAVMRREAFTPYGEPTYIPRHYLVFLSPDDDKEWHGEKRRGMERGLHNAIRERALELVGKQHLQADSITLELRADATLSKGQVIVQALWEEVEKTTVLSKPGKRSLEDIATDDEVDLAEATTVVLQFTLQLKRGAVAESRPQFAAQVTIGRGKDCEVQLPDDTSISRLHATLTKQPDKTFTLHAHGRNPLKLGDGKELTAGQEVQLQRGESFHIGEYELTIK
jgi:hypothetical protein